MQRHGERFVSSSTGALTSLVIAINAPSDEDLAHDVAAIKHKTGVFCILIRADYVEPGELLVGAHVSNRARRRPIWRPHFTTAPARRAVLSRTRAILLWTPAKVLPRCILAGERAAAREARRRRPGAGARIRSA
jgi:hypothetical protein